MEAWLLVPIRLVGVALIVSLVYLCFDAVQQDVANAFPTAPATDAEHQTFQPRTNRVVPLLAGILFVSAIVISVERRYLRRFQTVVDQIESLQGSILFDPPASHPAKQYNSKIVSVDLSDTAVNDELFPDLHRIPNLKVVRLANTNVGPDSLREIARCRKMERIDISQTPVTSDMLNALSTLPNLKCLIANDTPIDDDAIAILSSCQQLVQIEAENTCLSEKGIETLAAALPMAKTSVTSAPS